MNDLFANPYFKEFIIPLLAVFLTVGVKVVSRKDSFVSLEKDDFAIGFDLIVSSLILLVTYSSKIAIDLHKGTADNVELCQRKLEYLPWILFFSVFGLWALSTIIRIYGWENNQSKVLKLWQGIILPTFVGLIALLLTVNFIE